MFAPVSTRGTLRFIKAFSEVNMVVANQINSLQKFWGDCYIHMVLLIIQYYSCKPPEAYKKEVVRCKFESPLLSGTQWCWLQIPGMIDMSQQNGGGATSPYGMEGGDEEVTHHDAAAAAPKPDHEEVLKGYLCPGCWRVLSQGVRINIQNEIIR